MIEASQVQEISAEFPFESHFVDVNGHKMHYIEQGEGDPVLFLHGIPTWSYLWRNIVPSMAEHSRAIAVDMIGMGRSDKPDISYHVLDHIDYIEQFIDALGLKNVTLVMHAWGSVIGFDYAMRHPENVKGLAFLEAHIRPATERDMVALPVQQWSSILNNPDQGFDEVMNGNYFINKVLPWGCMRRLSEVEMEHYREPFAEPGSCRPLWQYFEDLPLGLGTPAKVVELIANYSAKLLESKLPKLMLYAVPGFITPMSTVQWAKDNLPNLTLEDIGDALHYAQESNPRKICEELTKWYKGI